MMQPNLSFNADTRRARLRLRYRSPVTFVRQGATSVRMTIVVIVGWVVGLAAYFAAMLLIYGEPPAWSGDTKALLFWSAVAFGISFVVLYVPALHAVRRVLGGVTPRRPFPVIAGALGVVPTYTIAFFNGGDLRSLISQDAFLFYIMFAATGLVVGVGYAVVHRNAPAP